MEKVLLVASILSLHYPIGLFADTDRKFKRMKFYGKDFEYRIRNGIMNESNPIFSFSFSFIAIISSVIIAYFPLKELLNFGWFYTILLNLAISLIVAPTLAFVTTPMMGINYKNQLKTKTLIYSILGIILYGITF